jgi:hypothetical protein
MTIVWDLIVLSFGRLLFAALRTQVPEKWNYLRYFF